MIFYPGTYVRLLTGIPLDNSYKDTFTFSNIQAQIDYFSSKVLYSYDKFTYQRYNPDRGQIATIRVPEVAEKLYNVNYVMFRNNNFGTKWFYAFVTQINYINDGMTELVYEIDILQTWMFDYQVLECFVEREHTNNDTIGANIITEDIMTGPYNSSNFQQWTQNENRNACIGLAATFDKNYQPKQGISMGNCYNGLCITLFKTADAASTFLDGASNVIDGIVSIFMVPQPIADFYFLPDVPGVETPDVLEAINGLPVINTWAITKQYGSFDGYTPKNNKLYCYPYNFLRIMTTQGQSLDLKYEFFTTSNCQFRMETVINLNPFILLIPQNYLECQSNMNYRMMLEGFPQCSYVTDVYKMWLAKNASTIDFNYFEAAANAGIGVASNILNLNWGGAVTSGLKGVVDVNRLMAKDEDMSRLPPAAHTGTPNADFDMGYLNFKYTRMKITKEYAKSIDDYFSMYGYKTLKLKVPNITGRRSWNFVKVVNANITGSMPADDLKRIIQIFEQGITFWHTPDLGNYALDNSIVG